MIHVVIFSLLSLLFGIVTFPLLFLIQKLLHLPVPIIHKDKLHIHHSFWGLVLLFVGIILWLLFKLTDGVYIGVYGFGWMLHHEISEPGLKGVGKFIHFPQEG